MWRIYQYIDSNKCGQTSRSAVEIKIQASCYFKARSFIRNSFMDFKLRICFDVFVEHACVLAQVRCCQNNPAASCNMARYKKTVFSALWIYLTLVACYLPYTIATAVITLRGMSPGNAIVWNVTGMLVLLNSSLNPVLYCWKIREVRQAVKETIRQCFCLS